MKKLFILSVVFATNIAAAQSQGTSISGTVAGGSVNLDFVTQSTIPRPNAFSAISPSIVHSPGSDTCMGSTTGAVQGLSLGVSMGSTWTDKHCEALRAATRLNEIGYKKTAAARLCLIPEIREAFEISGEFDCTKKQ